MSVGPGGPLGGIFGIETVRTIVTWQILAQIMQAVEAPFLSDLQQNVFTRFPHLPLTPPQLADLVVRGYQSQDQATNEAAKSGIDRTRFGLMVDGTGEPPALELLAQAWRRGIVEEKGEGAASTSLEQGIRESRLKNKYIPVIEALQWQLLPIAEVVQAWVRNQIPEAEARARLRQAGIKDEEATVLFNTTGRPPSLTELIELRRRKIIPMKGTGPQAKSFEQGIFEGDTKDKWEPEFEQLIRHVPPPRTVVALLRAGSITDAKAQELLEDSGLDPDLAAAYINNAHHQKLTRDRELAKADILTLYRDKLLSRAQATAHLTAMRYSKEDADFLLAMEDFREAAALTAGAVNRIRTLFLHRKLDGTRTQNALKELGVPNDQVVVLLRRWQIERSLLVQRLTSAEIVDAAFYNLLTEADALERLIALGWAPKDAWVRLGIRLHAKPAVPEPAGSLPPA